jgi:hypothetical protein
MFPGLSIFRKYIARKHVSWFVHLMESMTKKQCFLVCPPSRNVARNNISWFVHLQETWPGNNVSWFVHLQET